MRQSITPRRPLCGLRVGDIRRLSVPVTCYDHTIGSPDAPVTLVEYGDYDCLRCIQIESALKALCGRHVGHLRFVFRHFASHSIYHQVSAAAQAAEAAGAQGRFWEMHDLLLSHRTNRDTADMTFLGLTIGLEIYRFTADLCSGRYASRVRADYLSGVQSGVNRTPAFFLNGERIALRGIQSVIDAVECSIKSRTPDHRPNAPAGSIAESPR